MEILTAIYTVPNWIRSEWSSMMARPASWTPVHNPCKSCEILPNLCHLSSFWRPQAWTKCDTSMTICEWAIQWRKLEKTFQLLNGIHPSGKIGNSTLIQFLSRRGKLYSCPRCPFSLEAVPQSIARLLSNALLLHTMLQLTFDLLCSSCNVTVSSHYSKCSNFVQKIKLKLSASFVLNFPKS